MHPPSASFLALPRTHATVPLPPGGNRYPDGQLAPTPKGIDFTPGQLLGCVSGELGLRKVGAAQTHVCGRLCVGLCARG